MVSRELLAAAANSFQFDAETLVFLSNSCNEVYRFTRNNQQYILRFAVKPLAYVGKIKAELDWICYLVDNGVRASLPIKTKDDQLTAVYTENDKWFIATAFQMASGAGFDKSVSHLWGPAIFRKWGETMGKIHRLTKAYDDRDVAARRDEWTTWIINPHLQQGHYRVLVERLKNLEDGISTLPKEVHSYGLIHNDFHPYNFLIDNGEVTVFDFDDSIYSWYALDIGIAAAHAVWWGSPKEDRGTKQDFAKRFLNEFLTGYSRHNDLDTYWVQQIPMFMNYRNMCSIMWWLNSWDGDDSHLSEAQQNYILYVVKLIQDGLSFEGCDIQL